MQCSYCDKDAQTRHFAHGDWHPVCGEECARMPNGSSGGPQRVNGLLGDIWNYVTGQTPEPASEPEVVMPDLPLSAIPARAISALTAANPGAKFAAYVDPTTNGSVAKYLFYEKMDRGPSKWEQMIWKDGQAVSAHHLDDRQKARKVAAALGYFDLKPIPTDNRFLALVPRAQRFPSLNAALELPNYRTIIIASFVSGVSGAGTHVLAHASLAKTTEALSGLDNSPEWMLVAKDGTSAEPRAFVNVNSDGREIAYFGSTQSLLFHVTAPNGVEVWSTIPRYAILSDHLPVKVTNLRAPGASPQRVNGRLGDTWNRVTGQTPEPAPDPEALLADPYQFRRNELSALRVHKRNPGTLFVVPAKTDPDIFDAVFAALGDTTVRRTERGHMMPRSGWKRLHRDGDRIETDRPGGAVVDVYWAAWYDRDKGWTNGNVVLVSAPDAPGPVIWEFREPERVGVEHIGPRIGPLSWGKKKAAPVGEEDPYEFANTELFLLNLRDGPPMGTLIGIPSDNHNMKRVFYRPSDTMGDRIEALKEMRGTWKTLVHTEGGWVTPGDHTEYLKVDSDGKATWGTSSGVREYKLELMKRGPIRILWRADPILSAPVNAELIGADAQEAERLYQNAKAAYEAANARKAAYDAQMAEYDRRIAQVRELAVDLVELQRLASTQHETMVAAHKKELDDTIARHKEELAGMEKSIAEQQRRAEAVRQEESRLVEKKADFELHYITVDTHTFDIPKLEAAMRRAASAVEQARAKEQERAGGDDDEPAAKRTVSSSAAMTQAEEVGRSATGLTIYRLPAHPLNSEKLRRLSEALRAPGKTLLPGLLTGERKVLANSIDNFNATGVVFKVPVTKPERAALALAMGKVATALATSQTHAMPLFQMSAAWAVFVPAYEGSPKVRPIVAEALGGKWKEVLLRTGATADVFAFVPTALLTDDRDAVARTYREALEALAPANDVPLPMDVTPSFAPPFSASSSSAPVKPASSSSSSSSSFVPPFSASSSSAPVKPASSSSSSLAPPTATSSSSAAPAAAKPREKKEKKEKKMKKEKKKKLREVAVSSSSSGPTPSGGAFEDLMFAL